MSRSGVILESTGGQDREHNRAHSHECGDARVAAQRWDSRRLWPRWGEDDAWAPRKAGESETRGPLCVGAQRFCDLW